MKRVLITVSLSASSLLMFVGEAFARSSWSGLH